MMLCGFQRYINYIEHASYKTGSRKHYGNSIVRNGTLRVSLPQLAHASAKVTIAKQKIPLPYYIADWLARFLRMYSVLSLCTNDFSLRPNFTSSVSDRERTAVIGELGEALGLLLLTHEYGCVELDRFENWICQQSQHWFNVVSVSNNQLAPTRTTLRRSRADYVLARDGKVVMSEFKGTSNSRWRKHMNDALEQLDNVQTLLCSAGLSFLTGSMYGSVAVIPECNSFARPAIHLCDPEDQTPTDNPDLSGLDAVYRSNYARWLEFIGVAGAYGALLMGDTVVPKRLMVDTVTIGQHTFCFPRIAAHEHCDWRYAVCIWRKNRSSLYRGFPVSCQTRFGLERNRFVRLLEIAREGRHHDAWRRLPKFDRLILDSRHEYGESMFEETSTFAVFPDGSISALPLFFDQWGVNQEEL